MQEDSEEEKKEERKSSKHAKNGKNGHSKREPLEKEFVSKGTVSASKLANKRTQKEALKKIKNKRNKGTTKDVPSAAQDEADASD